LNDYLIKLARNDEERRFVARLDELVQKAAQGIAGQSDFLDLRQQDLALAVAVNSSGISWHLTGGYEEAERKRLIVFPDWDQEANNQIAYLLVRHKDYQEQTIGHRDYLGAVLNLGIKREKLGDIVVQNPVAFLIIDIDLTNFVCQQLSRVKHCSVSVEIISSADFVFEPPQLTTLKISLASLRLDAAIAASFNLPRSDVNSFIEGGKVKLNQLETYKPSASVKTGDLVSVRGLGRFRLEDIGGISRKGRYQVRVSRW
jgi:RNA-binding protein YlmH